MKPVTDLAAFAASRRPVQARAKNALYGSARRALFKRMRGEEDWANGLINAAERLLRRTYRGEAGRLTSADLREFVETYRDQLRNTLGHTTRPDEDQIPVRAEALAASIGNSATNAGYSIAGHDHPDITVKTWITMHDDQVRHAHQEVDGQSVPVGDKFLVGGHAMSHPGDTSVPIDLWINCRCVVALTKEESVTTTASVQLHGVTEDEDEFTELDDFEEDEFDSATDQDELTVPWYGVLAPENVASGDKRMFGTDALRWRELPLPLAYQRTTAQGHDGALIVGRIDEIWKEGNLVKASGVFLQTAEMAGEAIGMLADGAIRGVSVDVDDATMQMQDSDGKPVEAAAFDDATVMNFTSGRICGATLCAIPAFAEAFVSLGDWPAQGEALVASCECEYAIDEGAWDGSASNYTDEQYYKATIIHLVTSGPERLSKSNNKLPILTPSGVLSRAGVHAAIGRLNQTDAPPEKISQAKAALRSAYQELKEDPPETIAANGETDEFGDDLDDFRTKTEDGPGWLTHPVDTERLRRYWTRGKGAAKIRWGTPGDFNRCRRHLAKYVKPQHLNGYCANRHYDATGFWPGKAPLERRKHSIEETAPAVNLVASAADEIEYRYFANPNFDGPHPLTIDDDGRVYGHLAQWGVCHIGMQGVCVTAPKSQTDYAYFLTGAARTEQGDVPVGHITLTTGHADLKWTPATTRAHYDNTGTVVADVTCGEDAHGIWFSGKIRDLDAATLRELRAAPISGDWRGVGTGQELVAALGVNVPGFNVPRVGIHDGRQTALVAAGIVLRSNDVDLSVAVMAAVDEIEARNRRRRMAALAKETHRDPKSRMSELAAKVST